MLSVHPRWWDSVLSSHALPHSHLSHIVQPGVQTSSRRVIPFVSRRTRVQTPKRSRNQLAICVDELAGYSARCPGRHASPLYLRFPRVVHTTLLDWLDRKTPRDARITVAEPDLTADIKPTTISYRPERERGLLSMTSHHCPADST